MSEFWQAEARFDWERYIDENGAIRALRGRKDEYLMGCPDCGKPKLAVNITRRAWRCFSCGDGGRDATSLVAKVEALLWHEAMARVLSGCEAVIGQLDQLKALEVDSAARPASWVPRVRAYPESYEPVGPQSPAGMMGVQYCLQRGIPVYVAQEMRLGVCSRGRFRGRLMFPVFDSGGRLIFYQGRATWQPHARERHIKTLSPRTDTETGEAGAGDVLLNLAYVAAKDCQRVVVTEGPIDCAHAWPDAVATFGKNISPRQIELLMRAGIRELDLCFDNDPARRAPDGRLLPGGSEAMMKAAPVLADLFTVRVVRLPVGKDPGDLTKDEIDQYRDQATVWGSGDRLQSIPYTLS